MSTSSGVNSPRVSTHRTSAGRPDTADGVHITRTHCQFPCDQGPTLSVYPPGAWYQIRNEADMQRLVQVQFIEGRAVAELIMRQS